MGRNEETKEKIENDFMSNEEEKLQPTRTENFTVKTKKKKDKVNSFPINDQPNTLKQNGTKTPLNRENKTHEAKKNNEKNKGKSPKKVGEMRKQSMKTWFLLCVASAVIALVAATTLSKHTASSNVNVDINLGHYFRKYKFEAINFYRSIYQNYGYSKVDLPPSDKQVKEIRVH